jgi:hypothetical protein
MSRPATVALDLRRAGRAAAVAVDRRSGPIAWSLLDAAAGEDAAALARRALRELKVKPREVRVLLGAEQAQVALLDHAAAPAEAEITAALFAEGYDRLSEPAVAALAVSPGTWLVAACGAAITEPLAAGLLAESAAEPAFVVDQLLAASGLEPGTALVETVERGEAGLLTAAGLGTTGATALDAPAPESRGEALPAACEPAHRLALCPALPRLTSPQGERRRQSLAWAHRAFRAALVFAALGLLAMAVGLRVTWASWTKNRAGAARAAGDLRLVKELQEIGTLVGETQKLRTELDGKTPPWPHLAGPVAALAQQLPPEVGWERLEIKDGALELEASAAGTAPADRLEALRHALDRSPGLLNLSWTPPAAEPQSPRLRQTFRAIVKGAPAPAPQGAAR